MKLIRFRPPLLQLLAALALVAFWPNTAHAQLVSTETYSPSNGSNVNGNQKTIVVGSDGYSRFLVLDNGELTYVRCLDTDCDSYDTKSWEISELSAYAYSLALGPDGYARIAYTTEQFIWDDDDCEYYFGTLNLIQCSDDGCSTSTTIPSITNLAEPVIAPMIVGSDGTAYIAYNNGNLDDGPQGIGLATCTSGSCTTSSIASGFSPYDYMGAAITLDSEGNPTFLYVDEESDCYGDDLGSTAHYYEEGTDTVVSSDADAFTMDMAIGSDGFGRLLFESYFDDNGGYFAQCTDAACDSASVNTISLSEGYGDYGSFGLGDDGNARIEINLDYNGNGFGLASYYVECTAADCSTYDSTLISADSDNSTGLASLTVDSNGIPRLIAQAFGEESSPVYQVQATCGDERDRLIQEYSTFGVHLTPTCSNFSQFTHSSYFSYTELRNGDDYSWALIRNPLVTAQGNGYGLDLWRANYGASRIINSGYRNPAHNNTIGGAAQSQHMYGTATDLDNQTGGMTEYNAMVTAATDAYADFIEPTTGPCGTACVHADWRAHDMGDYAEDAP